MAAQPAQRLLAVVTLVVIVTVAVTAIVAFGALSNSRNVQSFGTVKTVNVGVYWDNDCTNATSTVNWGTLEPGAAKNFTIYVKNEGSVAVVLSMSTENWNPASASSYITLSWNRESHALSHGSVVQAVLTLSVSSEISGITNFSFDIIITGTEST